MNKYRKTLIITLIFFLTIFVLIFLRDLNQTDQIRKYDSLVVSEMPSYWKLSAE
jgi:hypothetical protein